MNDAAAPKFRRRLLTFSLRSLLVMTAVAGMFSAWFAMKLQRSRQQREAVEVILESSGRVAYGDRLDDSGKIVEPANTFAPNWLRKLLGNDFFDSVIEVSLRNDAQLEQVPNLPTIQSIRLGCSKDYTDAGLANLPRLPHLRRLRFGAASNVTNAGLVHLGELKQLESLEMPYLQITDDGLRCLTDLPQLHSLFLGCSITDAGMIHLREFRQLRSLRFLNTPLTDAGLEQLAGLSSLKELKFYRVPVTNSGLRHLRGLTNLESLTIDSSQINNDGLAQLTVLTRLRELDVKRTAVTDAGAAKLQQALPNCQIDH